MRGKNIYNMTEGILLIDKPLDWTSQDVVNKIRRIFHTKKVGHTGTLDPLATGVLVVLIGNSCKLCDYFQRGNKEYIATVTFGIKTPTLDLESQIIEEENTEHLTEDILKDACQKFIGEQYQIPPMTSAIKIDGKPLYSLAHQGIEFDLKPRKIIINNINIEKSSYEKGHFIAEIRINCSHGTYIRSLARDIGEACNTFATLTGLVRVQNHIFNISDCISMEELKTATDPHQYLKGNKLLKNIFDYIDLNDKDTKTLSYGQYVPIKSEDKPLPYLAYHNDQLIAICRIKDNYLKPKKVFILP